MKTLALIATCMVFLTNRAATVSEVGNGNR